MEVHTTPTRRCPSSCGWHPWWSRDAGRGESVEVELRRRVRCTARDDEGIPTGELVPVGRAAVGRLLHRPRDRPSRCCGGRARSRSPSRAYCPCVVVYTSRSTRCASSRSPTRPTRSTSSRTSSRQANLSWCTPPGAGKGTDHDQPGDVERARRTPREAHRRAGGDPARDGGQGREVADARRVGAGVADSSSGARSACRWSTTTGRRRGSRWRSRLRVRPVVLVRQSASAAARPSPSARDSRRLNSLAASFKDKQAAGPGSPASSSSSRTAVFAS